MRIWLCIGLTLGLAACSDFPELESAVSEEAKRADYPSLVPSAELLNRRTDGRLTDTDGTNLQSRARNLQARAKLLRGITEINDATRRRLSGPLRRLGG